MRETRWEDNSPWAPGPVFSQLSRPITFWIKALRHSLHQTSPGLRIYGLGAEQTHLAQTLTVALPDSPNIHVPWTFHRADHEIFISDGLQPSYPHMTLNSNKSPVPTWGLDRGERADASCKRERTDQKESLWVSHLSPSLYLRFLQGGFQLSHVFLAHIEDGRLWSLSDWWPDDTQYLPGTETWKAWK